MDSLESGDLWQAYRRGELYTDSGIVDGAHLRYLLLAAPEPLVGHQPALRLKGMTIQGPVDLRDVTLACGLTFEEVDFTHPMELENLTVPALRFDRCRLRGINADRLCVGRVLRITESVVDGTMWLRDARIGAHVDLTGTTVVPTGYTGQRPTLGPGEGGPPPEYIGIDAECIVVDGDFHAELLTCSGAIFLNLARLSGVATFTSATIADGYIQAPSLRCAGLYANHGFRLNGTMNLYGSEINGPVDLAGATMANPGAISFGGWGVTVTGVFRADGATKLSGTLDLRAATLRGGLELSGMSCDEPGENGSVHLTRSVIDAGLVMRGCALNGLVNLSHAQISASVELAAVHIVGDLNADNVMVFGDFDAGEASIDGALKLRGARIVGTVDVEGARLGVDDEGRSLQADGLNAFQLSLQPHTPPGIVDLSHATVEVLQDSAQAWPARPMLDAFVYRQLRNNLSVKQRLEVLRRATPNAQPQPYEQLAAVYRAAGQERQARRVLREKLRRESRAGKWLQRLWGTIQDAAIGYGYLPGRAAAIIVSILLAGTVYFHAAARCAGQAGLCPVKPSEHPTWDPFLYTLDALVPIIDLGHQAAFDPTALDKAVMIVLMASGWVFATTLVAATGRALNRP